MAYRVEFDSKNVAAILQPAFQFYAWTTEHTFVFANLFPIQIKLAVV